jgi:RNase P subunit RPR2
MLKFKGSRLLFNRAVDEMYLFEERRTCPQCNTKIQKGDFCTNLYRKNGSHYLTFCCRDHQQEYEYSQLEEHGFFEDIYQPKTC